MGGVGVGEALGEGLVVGDAEGIGADEAGDGVVGDKAGDGAVGGGAVTGVEPSSQALSRVPVRRIARTRDEVVRSRSRGCLGITPR